MYKVLSLATIFTLKRAARQNIPMIRLQHNTVYKRFEVLDMCLALTLTISHASRLHILLYVREYSPIIISKLQLCRHDRARVLRRNYDAQTRMLNVGLITNSTAWISRALLLTIPADCSTLFNRECATS